MVTDRLVAHNTLKLMIFTDAGDHSTPAVADQRYTSTDYRYKSRLATQPQRFRRLAGDRRRTNPPANQNFPRNPDPRASQPAKLNPFRQPLSPPIT